MLYLNFFWVSFNILLLIAIVFVAVYFYNRKKVKR